MAALLGVFSFAVGTFVSATGLESGAGVTVGRGLVRGANFVDFNGLRGANFFGVVFFITLFAESWGFVC